jgi:hypothetical protein
MKDSWTWRSLDFLVVGVFVLLIVSAAFRLWWMMLLGGVAWKSTPGGKGISREPLRRGKRLTSETLQIL